MHTVCGADARIWTTKVQLTYCGAMTSCVTYCAKVGIYANRSGHTIGIGDIRFDIHVFTKFRQTPAHSSLIIGEIYVSMDVTYFLGQEPT